MTVGAFLLVVVASTAAAQPAGQAAQERSAQERVAWSVLENVRDALREDRGGDIALVVRSGLPAEAPRGAELLGALGASLREMLEHEPRVRRVEPIEDAAQGETLARALASRGFELLVEVAVTVRDNHLVVEGGVWSAGRRGWRDLLVARPERLGNVLVQERLDVELRAYVGGLARLSETSVTARSFALPSRGYVAFAVSNLDAEGRAEIVLAHAGGIEVLRLGGATAAQKLLVVGRDAGRAVDPSGTRSRRLVGTALVASDARVIIRTSDRAAALAVGMSGGRITVGAANGPCPPEAFPVDDGCARLAIGRDWFAAELVPRTDGRPAPPVLRSGFYARAARSLRQPDGAQTFVDAIVTPRGRLGVRVGTQQVGAVGYGAALAMADVDEDGMAELIVSSAAPIGAGDRISILRARPDGGLLAVWTSEPLPGSVLTAATGDVDGDGLQELLAIEEPAPQSTAPARLWVLR